LVVSISNEQTDVNRGIFDKTTSISAYVFDKSQRSL